MLRQTNHINKFSNDRIMIQLRNHKTFVLRNDKSKRNENNKL